MSSPDQVASAHADASALAARRVRRRKRKAASAAFKGLLALGGFELDPNLAEGLGGMRGEK